MNASTKTMENTNVTHLTLQYPICVINTVFNYNCQYDLGEQTVNNPNGFPMSALDAMDAMDPLLWLRYDRRVTTSDGTPTGTIKKLGLYMYPAGTDQTRTNIDHPEDCYDLVNGCLDVHQPNFGAKLTQKFNTLPSPAGKTAYVFGQYANTSSTADRTVAGQHFYDNYWYFFLAYQRAGASTAVPVITAMGEQTREDAINNYNLTHAQNPLSNATCVMDESMAWQQQFGS